MAYSSEKPPVVNPYAGQETPAPQTREAADLGNVVGQRNLEEKGLGGQIYGQSLNQLAYTVQQQNEQRALQQQQRDYYANQQAQRDAARDAIQQRINAGRTGMKYPGWNDDLADTTPAPGSIASGDTAYAIATEARRKNEIVDPYVMQKAIGEGFNYDPTLDRPGNLVESRATVPIRNNSGLPLSISRAQAEKYPTTTFFTPFGEAQTAVEKAKVGIVDNGEVGAYQKNYHGQWLLVSSGSRAALQSGQMSVGKPMTPIVYTQESAGTKFSSFADVPKAMEILANPDAYSGLGAEVYGGYGGIRRDNRTVASTGAQLSTFANPYNLATLVNPYAVNLPKSQQVAMGTIPWGNRVSDSTPTVFRIDSAGGFSPASGMLATLGISAGRSPQVSRAANTPIPGISGAFFTGEVGRVPSPTPISFATNEYMLPEDYITTYGKGTGSRFEQSVESSLQLYGMGVDITTGFLTGGRFTPFATQNKRTGLGAPVNQFDVDYLDTTRSDFSKFMGSSDLESRKAGLEGRANNLVTLQSGFESDNSRLTREGNDLRTVIANNTNLEGMWVGSEELYYNTSGRMKAFKMASEDYNSRLDIAKPQFDMFASESASYNKDVGDAELLFGRIGEAEQRGYKSGALTFQNFGGQLQLAPNPRNQRPYGALSDFGAMASSWILGFQGRTAEQYEFESAQRENLASSGKYTGFAARAFAADNMLFAAKKEIALHPENILGSAMSGAQISVVGAGIAGIEAAFPAASFIPAGSKAATFMKYAAPAAKVAVPVGLGAMFLWSASEEGKASPGKFEMNIGSGMTHLAAMTFGAMAVPAIVDASYMRAGATVRNGRIIGVMGDSRSAEVIGFAANKDIGLGFYRAPAGGAFDTVTLWNRMSTPRAEPTTTYNAFDGGQRFLPGGRSSGGSGGGGGGWTPPSSPSPYGGVALSQKAIDNYNMMWGGDQGVISRGLPPKAIANYNLAWGGDRGIVVPSNPIRIMGRIESVGGSRAIGMIGWSEPKIKVIGSGTRPIGLLPERTWSIETSAVINEYAASESPFNAGYTDDYDVDVGFKQIAIEMGITGIPTRVKTMQEFDAIQSEHPTLYRGVRNQRRIQNFFLKPEPHAMKGSYGSGYYTAYDYEIPKPFRDFKKKNPSAAFPTEFKGRDVASDYGSHIIAMKLMPGAKVATSKEIYAITKEMQGKYPDEVMDVVGWNIGRTALVHGYDALDITDMGYMLILNKNKVVAIEEPLITKPVTFLDTENGYPRHVKRIIPLGSGATPERLGTIQIMGLLTEGKPQLWEELGGRKVRAIGIKSGKTMLQDGWRVEGKFDRSEQYGAGHEEYMRMLDTVPQDILQSEYVDKYYPGMDAKTFRKQEYYAGKAYQNSEWGVIFDSQSGRVLSDVMGSAGEVENYASRLFPKAQKRAKELYPYASRVFVDTGHTHPNVGRIITAPSHHQQRNLSSPGADLLFDEAHDSYKRAFGLGTDQDLIKHPPKAATHLPLVFGSDISVGAHGGFMAYRSPYVAGEGRVIETTYGKGNKKGTAKQVNTDLWGQLNTDWKRFEELRLKTGWHGVSDSLTYTRHHPPVKLGYQEININHNIPLPQGSNRARSATIYDQIQAETFIEVANNPKYNMNAKFHKFQPPMPRIFRGGKQVELTLEDFQREGALLRYKQGKQIQISGVVQKEQTLSEKTGLEQLFGKEPSPKMQKVPKPESEILTYDGITWNTGKSDFAEANYWITAEEPAGQKEYHAVLNWETPQKMRQKTYDIFAARGEYGIPIEGARALMVGKERFYGVMYDPANVDTLKGLMTDRANIFTPLTFYHDRFGLLTEPQEGRHRIQTMIELGVTQAPVWNVFQSDVTGKRDPYYALSSESKRVMNSQRAYLPGQYPFEPVQRHQPLAKKYITLSDVKKESNWGEIQHSHIEEHSILRGVIEDRSTIPGTLYHVTTNMPAVMDEGILRHMPKTAGLGKGTSVAHHGVSFTTSIDDAMLIKTDLIRTVELAKGGDYRTSLKRYIEEDEAIAGHPIPAYGTVLEEYEFHEKIAKREKYNLQDTAIESLRFYRQQRDRFTNGRMQDPIIFGLSEVFSKVAPEKIGIVYAKKTSIPDDVLVRDPIGGFMHEIMVHSDVPVAGAVKPRRINRGMTQMLRAAPIVQSKGIIELKPGHAKWNTGSVDLAMFTSIIRSSGTRSWRAYAPKATLKMMPPDEYIAAQKEIMGIHWKEPAGQPVLTGEQRFNLGTDKRNLRKVKIELQKPTNVFDALVIERHADGMPTSYQDGRHRAVAAKQFGYDTLPVWEIRGKTDAEIKLSKVPDWATFEATHKLPVPKQINWEAARGKQKPANWNSMSKSEQIAWTKEKYGWQNEGEQNGFIDVYGESTQLLQRPGMPSEIKNRNVADTLNELQTSRLITETGAPEFGLFVNMKNGQLVDEFVGQRNEIKVSVVLDHLYDLPPGEYGFFHTHNPESIGETLSYSPLFSVSNNALNNALKSKLFERRTLGYPSMGDIHVSHRLRITHGKDTPRYISTEGIISQQGINIYKMNGSVRDAKEIYSEQAIDALYKNTFMFGRMHSTELHDAYKSNNQIEPMGLIADDYYLAPSGNVIARIGGGKPDAAKALAAKKITKEIRATEFKGKYPKIAKKYSLDAVKTWSGNTYNELLINRTPEGNLAAVAAIFPNSVDFYTGKKVTHTQFVGSTGVTTGAGSEVELATQYRAFEVGNNIVELTPDKTAVEFWRGRGFEYRGKSLKPRKQYEADVSKNMIKHVPMTLWQESPPLKKMSAAEVRARRAINPLSGRVPTPRGERIKTIRPIYNKRMAMPQAPPMELQMQPIKERQVVIQKKPYKEAIDLSKIVTVVEGRPTSVATRAEQAMIIRQYGLTHDEIKKAKKFGWSLNDLIRYREGEKAINEYDMQLQMMPKDLLKKQLKQHKGSMLIPEHQQHYLAVAGLGQHSLTEGNLGRKLAKREREQGRSLVFEPQYPRGMQGNRDGRKLVFDTKPEMRLASERISKRDLAMNQRMKELSAFDQKLERVSLPKQDVFNIPDQMSRQYVEPVTYTPTIGLPGLPVIPPFGLPFGGGGSSEGGGGRGHGKYPFREVIPLRWQLW